MTCSCRLSNDLATQRALEVCRRQVQPVVLRSQRRNLEENANESGIGVAKPRAENKIARALFYTALAHSRLMDFRAIAKHQAIRAPPTTSQSQSLLSLSTVLSYPPNWC